MGRAVLTKGNPTIGLGEWRSTGVFRMTVREATIPVDGIGLSRKFDLTQVDGDWMSFETSDQDVRIDISLHNRPRFGELGFFRNENGSQELVWSGGGEATGTVPFVPIDPTDPPDHPDPPDPPDTNIYNYYFALKQRPNNNFVAADFTMGQNGNNWVIPLTDPGDYPAGPGGEEPAFYIGVLVRHALGPIRHVYFTFGGGLDQIGGFIGPVENAVTRGATDYDMYVTNNAQYATTIGDGNQSITIQLEN